MCFSRHAPLFLSGKNQWKSDIRRKPWQPQAYIHFPQLLRWVHSPDVHQKRGFLGSVASRWQDWAETPRCCPTPDSTAFPTWDLGQFNVSELLFACLKSGKVLPAAWDQRDKCHHRTITGPGKSLRLWGIFARRVQTSFVPEETEAQGDGRLTHVPLGEVAGAQPGTRIPWW